MKVLVTGGTGFIGSHVAEQLQRMGHEVTILCRRDAPARDPACAVRRVVGDVTNPASLLAACAAQESVVHTAGLVGWGDDGSAHHRVNVLGTLNVVRAAIAHGVPRLVHLSSLIVHETPRWGEVLCETSPLRRRVATWDHYARSKLMAERVTFDACDRKAIAVVTIRPGVVLGPRDRWTTPWILRALARPPVALMGSGANSIPCVVVEELADAIARAATLPGLTSGVLDVAASLAMTQRELIEAHARAAGGPVATCAVPAPLVRTAAWLLDALDARGATSPLPPRRFAAVVAGADCRVDCARATAVLGWRGFASCEDAIHRAVAWERSEARESYAWPGVSERGHRTEPVAVAP
jgi:nucleoside-diphosphate-sugar epimerase